MSRREEILRKAEEMRRAEERIRKGLKADKPYTGFGMNSERMPLGCWLWIIGLGALVFFLLSKSVLH